MTMSDDQRIALVKHWFHDGISSNDLETATRVAHEVFCESYIDGDGPNAPQTRADFLDRVVAKVFEVFTDIDARIEFAICSGDVVASRLRFRAVQRAPYLGVAVTGTPIEFTETGFAFFDGDQVCRAMGDWDRHGLWQQLQTAERSHQEEASVS